MKTPTVEMLKKGYIVIPKSLLENYFATHGQTEGRFEALIRVLMNVNYSDTECDSCGLHLPPRRITPQPAPLGEPAGMETHANPELLQRNDQRRHHRATTLSQRNDADTSQQLRLMDGEAESVRNGKQFVGPEFPPLLGKVSRDDANSQSKHRTCKARMEKAERTRTTGGHRKRGGILLSLERHTVLQTSSDVSGG